MRGFACAAVLGLTMAAAPSHAADNAVELPKPTPNDQVWYGWQTLLVDAVAIGTFATTSASWGATSGVLGPIAVTLFASTPIIHAMHHRWKAFGTSLAMRVLLTFTAATVGLGIGGGSCLSCDLTTFDAPSQGLYIGALVGMVVSSAIDASALAWRPRFKLRTIPAWNVVPSITPHGGSVSFVQTF